MLQKWISKKGKKGVLGGEKERVKKNISRSTSRCMLRAEETPAEAGNT